MGRCMREGRNRERGASLPLSTRSLLMPTLTLALASNEKAPLYEYGPCNWPYLVKITQDTGFIDNLLDLERTRKGHPIRLRVRELRVSLRVRVTS